ncbi:MAG: diguanylate cyclase [Acidimicrobiia bacterium]
MDESVAADATARPRWPRLRGSQLRGWIIGVGALAGLAIVLSALVILAPLTAARTDLHRVTGDGVPLQSRLSVLRSALVDWQFFTERHLADRQPGVALDATDVVAGGQLVTTQTAAAKALERQLRRVGFTRDARDLETAMHAFGDAVTQLTPVASGRIVDDASVAQLVAAERAAGENVWAVTSRIDRHVSRAVTDLDTKRAEHRVSLGVAFLLVGAGLALLGVLLAAVGFGRRAGRREHDQQRVTRRHEYETRVQEALEMTKTEPDVYAIMGRALEESVPELQVELLIADSSRAHFRRALTNGAEFEGCSVVSPRDCPAATVGHALLFPSSGALNACPYLKGRPAGECSAACLPVSIGGRTVGVTHAVGRDGVLPNRHEVEALNFTSRRGSERIAMIRAFATSESQAQTDPLTGLLNRRSLENAVRDLRSDGVPFALAYGDLDHFKVLNDTHGHEAGDQALRLFARVLRDSLRPNEIAARYGGEEFVIVLPDCDTIIATGVLERVRESLALALNAGRVPPFTVTFGVASSDYADEFDEMVAIADRALLDAKAAGRNRVLVAARPAGVDDRLTSLGTGGADQPEVPHPA